MQNIAKLRNILADLAALHSAASVLAQEATSLVSADDTIQPRIGWRLPRNGELVVSNVMCCVEWRGRRCVLGPSLLFKMIHRLSRHPERYFTYELLMDEVWQRQCTEDAVRTLVKRLRRALNDAGMPGLASSIKVRGRCVGLFLGNHAS